MTIIDAKVAALELLKSTDASAAKGCLTGFGERVRNLAAFVLAAGESELEPKFSVPTAVAEGIKAAEESGDDLLYVTLTFFWHCANIMTAMTAKLDMDKTSLPSEILSEVHRLVMQNELLASENLSLSSHIDKLAKMLASTKRSADEYQFRAELLQKELERRGYTVTL